MLRLCNYRHTRHTLTSTSMTKSFRLLLFALLALQQLTAAPADTLILRSEYEKAGDIIYDLNAPNEGNITYSIQSGNSSNYYQIAAKTGIISILNPIPDQVGKTRIDTLLILAAGSHYSIRIADGLDYTCDKLKKRYTLLDTDKATYIDPNSQWTAYNNQWGSGTAVANTDFRVAILCKPSLPDSSILLWDTPSTPEPFAGAAVWCYHNLFFGNRNNMRENLTRFPFQIKSLDSLSLAFNFEQLYGNDEFKIAMNMFMTDESYLTTLANNDGDFFFVFDQKGTWIPPYPYSMRDTTIAGKPFALRYDNVQNNAFYERRRAIVQNNEKYLSGLLDINRMFRHFSQAGWLNTNQYIYHLQLGVEVTQGWGAVRINHAKMTMNFNTNTGTDPATTRDNVSVYPLPAHTFFRIKGSPEALAAVALFDLTGQNRTAALRLHSETPNCLLANCSTLSPGVYLLKTGQQTQKIVVE